MSTLPTVTPTIATPLSPLSTFIKAHERFLIVVLCLCLTLFIYARGASIIEKRDQQKADLANAALKTQVQKTAVEADNSQKAAQAYQQLAKQLAQSNAALIAAESVRDKVTITQQEADKQLPPTALATRWSSLIGVTPENVQASPTGFTVTDVAAASTVTQLEDVPRLKGDLQDQQTISSSQVKQLTALNTVNGDLNSQISGLNNQLTLQDKACTADKNLLKAQARKSKIKWFVAGVVAGVATRIFLKF